MAGKNKMTKDTVPEGFTVPMALTDLLPVVFFGLSFIKVGSLFSGALFIFGASLCLVSGVVKVLWKLIAAIKGKNIWPMFLQMRILMPLGFLLMILSVILNLKKFSLPAVISAVTGVPSVFFFTAGVTGMLMMILFTFLLDSSDPKSNWIEQGVNGLSQILIFIGILLI